jgi:hypothetical protein
MRRRILRETRESENRIEELLEKERTQLTSLGGAVQGTAGSDNLLERIDLVALLQERRNLCLHRRLAESVNVDGELLAQLFE